MDNSKEKEKSSKKSLLDWIIALIALAIFAICYFFWHCDIDLWVTVIGAVVLIAGIVLVQMQNRKIKKAHKE